MADGDILSDLPELTWGDLAPVPTSVVSYKFGHRNARREWPYVAAAGHDTVGRTPRVCTARMHFLDTMFDGVLYYSDRWPTWRVALEAGGSKTLVHPDVGAFEAVVENVEVEMQAGIRSGAIVDVTFEEDIPDPEAESAIANPTQDPEAAAAAADDAMVSAGIDYPDGMPESDFLSSYQAIKGEIFSATLRVTGAINRIQGLVGMVIDDLAFASNPEHTPHQVILTSFWVALDDTKKRIERKTEKALGQYKTRSDVSLSTLATMLNNTIDQLIELNLHLVYSPTVDAGTVVAFYK